MNRKYFFLAVNTGFSANGLPDERCREFYRRRSGHGLHCAIVGNVVTPGGVGTNDVCSIMSSDSKWGDLASSIADKGALPGIQLSSTWKGYTGIQKFVPSSADEQLRAYQKIGASISSPDAIATFDSLLRGTELAVKAGFRHVQVHAAHGYLFNILLDRELSPHSELSIKKLTRWAEELKSSGIETSIRFSMWSGHALFDQNRRNDIVDDLAAIPTDYLDASVGFYNINKRLIYPSSPQALTERTRVTLNIAERHRSVNFILSGLSTNAWQANLPHNVHIGICRDLIANPDYMLEKTNGCEKCMKCHYFSRGQSYLTCAKWSSSPKES